MSKQGKKFSKFWIEYRGLTQRATKYTTNPKLYIKDQLNIIRFTTARLIELRNERSTLNNDKLVDEQIDKLKNAIDARAIRVLDKADSQDKSMNETHLVREVIRAAAGTTISRGVFRAHEVISERTRAKTRIFNKEILSVAQRGEGMKCEFKKSISQYEAITKSLVSFANSSGGNIYVGVAEERDVKEDDTAVHITDKYWAVGVFNDIDSHRQKLTAFIIQHTNLTAGDYQMKLLEYDKKLILKINIQPIWKENQELYFLKNEVYMRNDNATYKLSGFEVYSKTKRMSIK